MAKKEKKDKSGGGFGLNKLFTKQSDVDAAEPAASGDVSGGGGAKRKSSPVLHESVFETVAGLCRKNKLFVVKRDGEDLFVGIYLDLDDIGGLSAKSKDEAKGSMVSEINAGNISILYNSELERMNGLIFIPTQSTIEHMMEYTLLREGRNYNLVLIDSQGDGDFEKTDVQVTLEMLKRHHDKRVNIKDKLGKYLEDVLPEGDTNLNNYGSNPAPVAPQIQPAVSDDDEPFEPGGPSELTDDDPYGPYGSDGDDPFGPDGDEEEPDFSGADSPDEGDPFGGSPFDDDDDGYTPGVSTGDDDDEDGYGEPEEEREIDYTVTRQVIARKFFNDNLTVELDTTGLDQALSVFAEFRPIEYRPSGSWMSDLLNPMIAVANQELFDLHRNNMAEVQTEYLNQLEQAYLDQMTKLSSEEVKAVLASLQAKYDEHKAEIPEKAKKLQEVAKADWEKRVHDAGEAARVAAEQAYRSKFQMQYEEQFRNITSNLQAELDADFNAVRGKYLTEKKDELLRQLDVDNAGIIQTYVEMYRSKLPEEQELLRQHQERIEAEVAKQRDNELSRIRVLDDELKRDTKVETLTREYNEKLAAVSTEFESRIATIQTDMDAQQRRHEADLANKDRELQELQMRYNRDRDDWNSRTNELLTQLRESDQVKSREVELRTAEMRAERDSYSEKYEHLQKTQKHGYMMMIAICVVAVIAAACIGMLIGTNLGGKDDARHEPPQGYYTPDDNPGNNFGDSGDVMPDDGSNVVMPSDGSQDTPVDPNVTAPAEPDNQGNGDELTDDEWAGLQDPVITAPA